MSNGIKTAAPNRSLLGRMSPAERAMGRFMRNPDDHTSTPLAPAPEDKTEVESAPADEPKVEAPQVDDEKARLLKDTMKHKSAAREAQAALEAANARLAAYEGIDPAVAKQMVAAQKEAELKEAEARGEYERIVEKMREAHTAETQRIRDEAASAQAALEAAQQRIDDLTVGRSFGDSKFISEATVLSPAKARALYGSHVEIVEGELVVYDKPKGSKNRTPLVDGSGEYLPFEAGIEKVIRGDPDFDSIGRATLKSGAKSTPAPTTKVEEKTAVATGRARIAASLQSQKIK